MMRKKVHKISKRSETVLRRNEKFTKKENDKKRKGNI